jgi:hypothetical protein
VIAMHEKHWLQAGARFAAAATALLFCAGAAGGGVRSTPAQFDLAIRDMNVKQLSSTPMFRTVEITCIVANRGPKASNATAWLLISRPGESSPQVLKVVSIPKPMEPGETFHVRSQTFAWAATAVPYRCEIEFGGAYTPGDADPSNDFAAFTFPKL